MARRWSNWSGSVRCRPARLERPGGEDELAGIVRDAHRAGRTVRAVGTGHSSHPMLGGEEILLSTRRLRGVVAVDRARCRARVWSGTTLERLGRALHEHDLALPNYGDVATQTIGGAIGTGTHGTGPRLHNLSRLLVGARVVDGRGEPRTLASGAADTLRAARVALGALGVLTELELELVPAWDAERREYACRAAEALERFETLSAENRSLDFYWYPRRDDVKLRLVNPVGGGSGAATMGFARLLERREGASHLIIPTHSGIPHRFEECEYAVPAERGLDCFRAVRQRVLQRWRATVAWRVLYRTVAGDDAFLSPTQDRPSATISLHQNVGLPWRRFFADLEAVFAEFGGRPHWAKKHSLQGAALAARFPHWDRFHAVRRGFDPDGTFLAAPLRRLFGLEAS